MTPPKKARPAPRARAAAKPSGPRKSIQAKAPAGKAGRTSSRAPKAAPKRPPAKAKPAPQPAAPASPQIPTPIALQPPAPAPAPAPPTAPALAPPTAPAPAPVGLLPDLPFHELSRDAASAFVYAALAPDEVLALVKQLGLTARGFRPEALGEVERCDLLADDLRAGPEARRPVQEILRRALKEPAFAASTLDPGAAEELLEVAGSDHGLAIALWRLLADPQPEVRARGAAALDRLAAEWYGPPPGDGEAEAPDGGAVPTASPSSSGRGGGSAGAGPDAAALKALRQKLARAEAQAESQRLRGEERAGKLQGQLKEARAEAARAVDEAARARQVAEAARLAQVQAEAALAAARSADAAADASRLRTALREAEVKLHAAEGRTARAEAQQAAAEAALQGARSAAAGAPTPSSGAAETQDGGGEPEEAPAAWLLPIFTGEFYASLAGWDRRIQRAALKQAFLLSQDHRHPSLRALPLEGLPGYYRVRVATDVRLIYRRGERQDEVELCSLIDREDLDRYVRQAKTR